MKRFLTLLTVLMALSLQAQTVKGVLTDGETGEAIPLANVGLDSTKYGNASDINGFYLINKMPAGTYKLRVRYVGYEEFVEQITLKKGQNIIRGAVINGPGMSDFCLRFLNEDGTPVKNVTVSVK